MTDEQAREELAEIAAPATGPTTWRIIGLDTNVEGICSLDGARAIAYAIVAAGRNVALVRVGPDGRQDASRDWMVVNPEGSR